MNVFDNEQQKKKSYAQCSCFIEKKMGLNDCIFKLKFHLNYYYHRSLFL